MYYCVKLFAKNEFEKSASDFDSCVRGENEKENTQ